jgi:hypothetical protein
MASQVHWLALLVMVTHRIPLPPLVVVVVAVWWGRRLRFGPAGQVRWRPTNGHGSWVMPA